MKEEEEYLIRRRELIEQGYNFAVASEIAYREVFLEGGNKNE